MIQAGERIAQIIRKKINTETAVQVEHLPKTDRGIRGFGTMDMNPKQTIQSNQTRIFLILAIAKYI